MQFLLDENIPNEFKKALKSRGFVVESINVKKYSGMSDKEVLNLAYKKHLVIISFDADFCNLKKENHFGIIKINGKLENSLEILLELIELYKNKDIKNTFFEIKERKAYIETKVYSKKKNRFKQFKRTPIDLKSLN